MMNKFITALSTVAFITAAGAAQAGSEKDCLLEGTVYKSGDAGQEQTDVKFHSAERYDKDANCRVRRGEKMEFKLPTDSRLEDAPSGSSVKYRYQQEQDGSSTAELVSVGA
jgi:hypothetical protein